MPNSEAFVMAERLPKRSEGNFETDSEGANSNGVACMIFKRRQHVGNSGTSFAK